MEEENRPMAANANVNFEVKVGEEKKADESCAPATPKDRLGKLLREVFEGREEYLGMTPD
jgi:hypothetical protein